MGGHFYAIGGNGSTGKFGDSVDGLSWTVNTPGSIDTLPTGFAYSPALGLFISGGTGTTINRASNGHGAWSSAASEPFTSSTRMCGWSPDLGLFVAGAEDGRIASSSDGSTFTQRQTGAGFVRGSVWSPDLSLWVVVSTGGASGRCFTSPDGITWTGRTIPGSIPLCNDVAWSPALGLFVATGRIGTNPALWSSPDGVTWTQRTATALGTGTHAWPVCWGADAGVFVAGSLAGNLAYSSDGITWTGVSDWTTAFGAVAVNGIAYGAGLFIAVGDGGKMMSSPDGVTWTTRTSGFGTTNITEIIFVQTGGGLVVGFMTLA
jgi:hypothetical protein